VPCGRQQARLFGGTLRPAPLKTAGAQGAILYAGTVHANGFGGGWRGNHSNARESWPTMKHLERLFDLTKTQQSATEAKSSPTTAAAHAEPHPGIPPAPKPLASVLPSDNIHIHLDGPSSSAKANESSCKAQANSPASPEAKAAAKSSGLRHERRHRRRVKISAPVRVRQVNVPHTTEYEYTMTLDVSREGLLFETTNASYARGQEVAIVFPYRPAPGDSVKEQRGLVVRVARASERRYGIAIAFLDGEPGHEVVDASGRPIRAANEYTYGGKKKLVVVVEEEPRQREALRMELEGEGYAVEAVANPSEASALIGRHEPAAIVCEAEPFAGALPDGAEMSGYDLCVILRRNPLYARLPVILTTRTGLPSDFATAHALGATVCIAKPYDLGRVAHVLRILAPVETK
jgi:CheY-like chemotaxis protein